MAEPGVLDAALRAAGKRKASARVRKALVLAGLVETELQHKKYSRKGSGDRDSVGFLQQRPSQGWGPAGESVEQDTNQFLDRAIKLNASGQYGSAGSLAQAVQRSAFPERYDQRSAEADRLLKGALGSTQAPSIDNDASRTSNTRNIIGMTKDASQEPSVYDVIRRFNVATDPNLSDEERTMQEQLLQAANRYQVPKMTVTSLGGDETPDRPSTPHSGGSTNRGKFKITGPNPGRLKPELVDFAEEVAGVYGKPLSGSDGTGHSYRTVNGNVSQHSTGNATDIPARGRALIQMGQSALIAAGMPEREARKQQGGLYNVNGHQIIFNTQEGGDHTDHLHISAVRKKKR